MRLAMLFILLASQLAACIKAEITTPVETAVTKTIQFEIGRVADYSSSYYNNMHVDIILDISLQDYTTSNYTKLWDTTYSIRSVFDFPAMAQPILLEKKATNPDPNKNSIKASYNLRFCKDNIIQWQSAAIQPVISGNDREIIKVNL